MEKEKFDLKTCTYLMIDTPMTFRVREAGIPQCGCRPSGMLCAYYEDQEKCGDYAPRNV